MAYSCECTRHEDFFHCGGCFTDADNDDPEVDAQRCEMCNYPSEIYIEEGSHFLCDDQIGRWCIHYCDGDECAFLVGINAPPEDYDGDLWVSADNIPDEIWYHCLECNQISFSPHVDCQCENYSSSCWKCATCPSCKISISMENLCTPLSIVLKCEREECYGSDVGNDEWPSEYYCDCCDASEPSEWNGNEGFFCGRCEKYHDDDERNCCFYNEENDNCNHPDHFYDDDDEKEEGNAIAVFFIDLAYFDSNFDNFLGEDGATYITVNCHFCGEPLHARVSIPDLDAFLGDRFWELEGSICPPEMFPDLEQVDSVPIRMSESGFDKSDFDKSDFNKSDFDKGG